MRREAGEIPALTRNREPLLRRAGTLQPVAQPSTAAANAPVMENPSPVSAAKRMTENERSALGGFARRN